MKLTTYQFRIKDATAGKHLSRMASAVNYTWNYCNQVNGERWTKFRKTFSNYELHKLTAGCAKDLGLHSQTLQAICDEYAQACKQTKRTRLNWRSHKRSLGWVPFKAIGVKLQADSVTYCGRRLRFWLSRPIEGKVRCGSFTQDAGGRWYLNLVLEEADKGRIKTGREVGIDLGLKTIATLSDGVTLDRDNLTKKYEQQLSIAQRARKKRRVTVIHAKIKNQRKDWTHKATTQLVRDYDRIIVGNVSASKLMKTRMAKSVQDAGWYTFKLLLGYKAASLGVEVKEVNERFSTVTCSTCSQRTGPSGLSGLGVRMWVCSHCGTVHDRDVNAAKNILHTSLSGMTGQLRESHQ